MAPLGRVGISGKLIDDNKHALKHQVGDAVEKCRCCEWIAGRKPAPNHLALHFRGNTVLLNSEPIE